MNRLKHSDWIYAAIICLLILIFFGKTCFAGGSISRLCVLAEWDSVFDAWRTGRPQAYDPSLVQIFLPDYVFLARNLCRGVLPLWNPHCGLGYPFVADIQSSVFAPLRLVFDLFPRLCTYNWYLISEILVCGVSSYFLALKLAAWSDSGKERSLPDRLCALFAAICFTFCPYNLWYLELNLGSSASLFPLTALAFVHAAERRTVGAALLAGLVAGLLIVSGHPECSFFGIALSSLLMILLWNLPARASLAASILSSLKALLLAAFATLALAAPVLFPFVEYLLNAESYKYGSAYSTPVTWNGIAFNLCNPGQNGASPYLGIVALICMPIALAGASRHAANKSASRALLFLTLFTFVLVSQLGPVQDLFGRAPLTALITRYALPYLLMLQSLLAGFGLRELARLQERKADPQSRKFAALATLFLVLFTALVSFWSFSLAGHQAWFKIADFDAMLPATAFNQTAWRRDIVCAAIFTLLSIAGLWLARLRNLAAMPLVGNLLTSSVALIIVPALVAGFISEGSLAKLSLPQQSKFFYPENELLKKLENNPNRTISTCEYVLRPATNAVYGINFLSVHNPLFPHRFLEFMKACGATTDVFNQKFDTTLSPLLNLASVKYVLALEPVIDAQGQTSQRFALDYQSRNKIRIYVNKNAAPRAYLVHRSHYEPSAETALKFIQSEQFNARSTVVLESAGPAASRSKISPGKTEQVAGKSSNGQANGSISRGKPGAGEKDGNQTSNSSSVLQDRAHDAGDSGKNSGQDKNSRQEKNSRQDQPLGIKTSKREVQSYEEVERLDLTNVNSVRVACAPATPGWLILTDIYYPGWHAYVDGKETKIERANYAFKAIKLAAGSHRIEFVYEPFSFLAGCTILVSFGLLSMALLVSGVCKREI